MTKISEATEKLFSAIADRQALLLPGAKTDETGAAKNVHVRLDDLVSAFGLMRETNFDTISALAEDEWATFENPTDPGDFRIGVYRGMPAANAFGAIQVFALADDSVPIQLTGTTPVVQAGSGKLHEHEITAASTYTASGIREGWGVALDIRNGTGSAINATFSSDFILAKGKTQTEAIPAQTRVLYRGSTSSALEIHWVKAGEMPS